MLSLPHENISNSNIIKLDSSHALCACNNAMNDECKTKTPSK